MSRSSPREKVHGGFFNLCALFGSPVGYGTLFEDMQEGLGFRSPVP